MKYWYLDEVNIIAICIGWLAFICNICALATPVWTHSPDGITIGLFEICRPDGCEYYHNYMAFFQAVRAFMVISCIVIGIACIIMTYSQATKQHDEIHLSGTTTLLVGSIFAMIGASIFTARFIHSNNMGVTSWGHSFVFAWLTFCLAFFGAIVSQITTMFILEIYEKGDIEERKEEVPVEGGAPLAEGDEVVVVDEEGGEVVVVEGEEEEGSHHSDSSSSSSSSSSDDETTVVRTVETVTTTTTVTEVVEERDPDDVVVADEGQEVVVVGGDNNDEVVVENA